MKFLIKSALSRPIQISDVKYIDPVTGIATKGNIYLSLCSLMKSVPEGCQAEHVATHAYFFDHEKTCIPLTLDDGSSSSTVWKVDIDYEV